MVTTASYPSAIFFAAHAVALSSLVKKLQTWPVRALRLAILGIGDINGVRHRLGELPPHRLSRGIRWSYPDSGPASAGATIRVVTEPAAPSRQSPKRPPATIDDLVLLVLVPGRPDAIRACTAAERGEADAYASAAGGSVEPLPLSRA